MTSVRTSLLFWPLPCTLAFGLLVGVSLAEKTALAQSREISASVGGDTSVRTTLTRNQNERNNSLTRSTVAGARATGALEARLLWESRTLTSRLSLSGGQNYYSSQRNGFELAREDRSAAVGWVGQTSSESPRSRFKWLTSAFLDTSPEASQSPEDSSENDAGLQLLARLPREFFSTRPSRLAQTQLEWGYTLTPSVSAGAVLAANISQREQTRVAFAAGGSLGKEFTARTSARAAVQLSQQRNPVSARPSHEARSTLESGHLFSEGFSGRVQAGCSVFMRAGDSVGNSGARRCFWLFLGSLAWESSDTQRLQLTALRAPSPRQEGGEVYYTQGADLVATRTFSPSQSGSLVAGYRKELSAPETTPPESGGENLLQGSFAGINYVWLLGSSLAQSNTTSLTAAYQVSQTKADRFASTQHAVSLGVSHDFL